MSNPDSFHLLTIVGNRPQFVKMAPLSAELNSRGFREYIVHTGQHFDDNMSRVFFEELGLPLPDVNLDISSGGHGEMTGRMLIRIEQILLEKKPRSVLLYGDTNSTLAGALAAVKLHIPFAHVEAGPRIYDMTSPEEMNRLVADHGATLRFCPDELSVKNLARENITAGAYFTGDVMYDAFVRFSRVAAEMSGILQRLGVKDEPFALMTVHRPNNTDSHDAVERLIEIFRGSSMKIVFPAHPRTENALRKFNLLDTVKKLPGLIMIPAVGYIDILQLVNHARIVLTDSGGLQKEAYFAGKPCITLFTTPWPAIEEAGWQTTAWTGAAIDTARVLDGVKNYRPASQRPNLFGDGRAAAKMVDAMERHGLILRE